MKNQAAEKMKFNTSYIELNSSNLTKVNISATGLDPLYIPSTVIFTATIITGFIGNGLTTTSILYFKNLRTNPTYIILKNQSFADLLITLVVLTGSAVGPWIGSEFFIEHHTLCHAISAICLISCATTLLSMGILALNRFIAILYPNGYSSWFTVKKAILYCAATWILALLLETINFTEIGGHVYDLKAKGCFFNRLKKEFTATFVVACIYLPCLAIAAFYLKIYLYVKDAKLRVKQATSSQNESIVVAKSLFTAFIVFAVSWLPISVIFLCGFDDQLPAWLHVYGNLLAHTNSAINPILYATLNPTMREAYKFLLRKLTCSFLFPDFVPKRLVFNARNTVAVLASCKTPTAAK
nr:G protein-coupled receptor [Proales similis]